RPHRLDFAFLRVNNRNCSGGAMSYRAFKRLLGETSLERKCRLLFTVFILLLITGSFWLYHWKTEHLAYDQIKTTCRLLVIQVMARELASKCRPLPGPSPTATAGAVGAAAAVPAAPLLAASGLAAARAVEEGPAEA